jgi:hypothetical protein
MPLRRPPATSSRAARPRARLALPALFVALAPSVAASGCGTTTEPTGTTGPTGTPTLLVTSPAPSTCFSIGADPDAHLPVQVEVSHFALRPPGTCGLARQCGFLQLLVNGVPNNQSAAPNIDVLVRKLADRYATLELTVELVDEAGKPFVVAEKPVASSVTIRTAVACEDAGGGGGAGGTGGAGGATTSAGGAGGAGGATSGAGGATSGAGGATSGAGGATSGAGGAGG